MNAEVLIDDVVTTIQDPSVTRDEILKLLNLGMNYIASRVLLPGLANGHDTLETVVDDYQIDLPDDYHRGLFLAKFDGTEISTVKTLQEIYIVYPGLSMAEDRGSVVVVAVSKTKLVYYRIPEEASDIEIFYHRKPVEMTDSTDSFPDGISENDYEDEAYDEALKYFACWKLYENIEQGIEGEKIDTGYHFSGFKNLLDDIKFISIREGISFPKTTPNKTW